MHIAIIAFGSRGDVQPYIALGKGLKAAGHAVRLVTHQDFDGLVNAHRLEGWFVRGSVQEVVQSPQMAKLLETGNFIKISMYTAKMAQRAAIEWAEDSLKACEGMNLIIAGIGGMFSGLALAEKLNIPMLQAHLIPLTPTRAFPSVLLPKTFGSLGGSFNHASHYLTQQALWQGVRAADNAARQQVLGLSKNAFWGPFNAERLRQLPTLYGISPAVIPKPVDWGSNVHITGYWFLDAESDWSPSPALTDFLQAGPPPVYIGFGSMGSRKPGETADLVLQAIAQTRQRAILMSGWGGLQKANLPDSVFMVDSIPHSWLFPHVAAVVHHGGAGTTAAGLRAGVPSIITPFFADQPFWANCVAELGVGAKPIPRNRLTANRLADAIQKVVADDALRKRAAQFGAAIRAEDGIAHAVEVIQAVEKSSVV